MSKYNALIKKYDQAQTNKVRLAQEIEDLKAKKAEIEKTAEAAARDGNEEEYIRLRRDAEEIGSRAYVKEKLLAATENPVTREETIDAWDEYIRPINKQLEKALAAHLKKRQELYESFKEIKRIQDSAFSVRQQLADMIGYCSNSGFPYDGIDGVYKMFRVTGSDIKPDLDLFIDLKLIEYMEAVNYCSLLNTGRTNT